MKTYDGDKLGKLIAFRDEKTHRKQMGVIMGFRDNDGIPYYLVKVKVGSLTGETIEVPMYI